TSSGESLRCPRKVHVTPYSFSTPYIRRSTRQGYVPSPPDDSITRVLACRGGSGAGQRGQQVLVVDVDGVGAGAVDPGRLAQGRQRGGIGLPVVEEPGLGAGDQEACPVGPGVVPGALGLPQVRLERAGQHGPDRDG